MKPLVTRLTKATVLGLLLTANPALAWPVDWLHDVEAGKEKFVKLPRVDWLEVEDTSVATAEWVAGANELILTGVKEGRTVVLLGAEGKVAAWRVRVGKKTATLAASEFAAKDAARKACPSFREAPSEDVSLSVQVKSEACLKALRALFETDAFEARRLELEFDGAVLQSQLKALQGGLDSVTHGKVSAKYVGAGLVLSGRCSQAEYRKLLWEVLRRTVGRFALDDRIDVEATDAIDGGP